MDAKENLKHFHGRNQTNKCLLNASFITSTPKERKGAEGVEDAVFAFKNIMLKIIITENKISKTLENGITTDDL